MNKQLTDQYNMLLSVENHFDDNTTLWNTNTPIAATKTLLTSRLDTIAAVYARQLVNTTGVTIDKAKQRTDLENHMFLISAATSGYAAVVSKMDLYKRVHYTRTDLARFSEAELIGIATNLHLHTQAEIANLAPYGVLPATLTQLQTYINNFSASLKNPDEAIANRKTATEKLPDLLREAIDTLLDIRLDNQIIALQATQPDFVATYFNLRAIKSSATTTISLTITTIDIATQLPIPNVNIELVGEGITRISSDRGYNTVLNLVSGTHTLAATHPNYKPATVEFTIVNNETTELILQMEARG